MFEWNLFVQKHVWHRHSVTSWYSVPVSFSRNCCNRLSSGNFIFKKVSQDKESILSYSFSLVSSVYLNMVSTFQIPLETSWKNISLLF